MHIQCMQSRMCQPSQTRARATGHIRCMHMLTTAPFPHRYVSDRIQKMLREHHMAYDTPLLSQRQCLAFLGHRFRHLLRPSERTNAVEAGELLLRRHVFVHLPSDAVSSKWDLLVLMLQKLYALGARRISQDNPDSLVHQEVLLPDQI